MAPVWFRPETYWLFFIDQQPEYGWGHACTYVFINANDGNYSIEIKQLPPNRYTQVLEHVSVPISFTISTPNLNIPNTMNYPPENHSLYAVLFTGGELGVGTFAFWNAFSHMYCGLREHGYPKENIYVLSDNGEVNANNFSLDLDNDGVGDILPIPCSKANVDTIFTQLADQMSEGDLLYVFVSTHGDYDTTDSLKYYFLLDNQEKLSNYEFHDMLEPIHCAQMIINLWCCYAGGFTEQISNIDNPAKKTILTCTGNQPVHRLHSFFQKTGMDSYNYLVGTALRGWHPDVLDTANRAPWAVTSAIGLLDSIKFAELFSLQPVEFNYDLTDNGGNNNGIQEINEVINYTKEYDGPFKLFGSKIYDCGFHQPNPSQPTEDLLSLYGITGKVQYSQTVTGNFLIGGTLSVEPGVDLTLDDDAAFHVLDSKIIVKPGIQNQNLSGGKLIIDGATLTSADENRAWDGIEVQGNAGLSQVPVSNQGYVRIYKNSIIEHANPAIQSENGGIIIASDAVFKNNQRSVILLNYPSFKNISLFTRCKFVIDDKTILSGNEYFIGAQYVNPLAVYGCTFENNIPFGEVAADHRGRGIWLSNADLIVSATSAYNPSPDPLEVKTTFRGLYYGIYSLRSSNQYTSSIMYANFEDNLRGLYQSGYNGISYNLVAKNKFKVLQPALAPGYQGYGMYLNHCSGYTVEENDFYSEGTTPGGTGLIINESGPGDNQVYNNIFHNLDQGSKPQGQNRLSTTNGLCYRCNDFYGNNNDILVVSENPGSPNQGIATSQGSANNAAKNTFTMGNNSSATLFDIHNPFTGINYYYDYNPGPGSIVDPEPTVGVIKNPVPTQYNKGINCPSHFGSSNIDEETSKLIISGSKSDSLIQVLAVNIDGGSTEVLSGEVLSSTPPQAMETSEQLLNDSPFLSDSVMRAAIAKEDVLSNAMIRDVLVENPQSAKSIEVLNSLDQRFIPMPDSMMVDIMDGLNTLGPKEIKEIELLNWNRQYAESMKSLIRIYSEDSTGINVTDSLKMLLQQDGTLNSCYDLVSLYFGDEMYETGFATIDSIPVKYDLTGSQVVQHNQMEQLFEIIYKVDTSQLKVGTLDSIQIQTLINMSFQDANLPGAYARDLLIMGGHLDYEEPIIDPGILKASKDWKHNDPSTIKSSEYLLKVYPNPSKTYFIVEYRQLKGINGSGKTSIVVTDIYGKEIMEIPADRYYDQVVVRTNMFSSGSYFVALKVDGAVKKAIKVSVVN